MRFSSKFAIFLKILVIFQIFVSIFYVFSNFSNISKSDVDEKLNEFQSIRRKSSRSLNISVIIVVDKIEKAENDYSVALNSVRCYCKLHNYKFLLASVQNYRNSCPQKDIMFQRHCVVSYLLQHSDWSLFIDADIAVFNPKILIEEFIDARYHITFYDRFVNWEIAAGSYIVKNSQWSIDFLRSLANFEFKLPPSFHGSDNGALHVYLQQLFYPQLEEDAKICLKIWEESDGFDSLFTFEACIRSVMGNNRNFEFVRILKKGTGWVRDIWLTDSEWSPQRDFMIHGLKDSMMTTFSQGFFINLILTKFNWRTPFKSKMNLLECSDESKTWNFDENLIVSEEKIIKYFKKIYLEVEKKRWNYLSLVAKYL